MNEISLLYFFSALAQSAAALTAIAAVFAVFKLQANQSIVRERLAEANDAFNAGWHYRWADSRLKADLKYTAYEADDDTEEGRKAKAKAKECFARIEEAEGLNRGLANDLRLPLKLWIGIFLGSLPMLAVARFIQGWLGAILAGVFMIATSVAAWKTKTFVQKCLVTVREKFSAVLYDLTYPEGKHPLNDRDIIVANPKCPLHQVTMEYKQPGHYPGGGLRPSGWDCPGCRFVPKNQADQLRVQAISNVIKHCPE